MLALICGTGGLPAAIAAAQAEPPLVCVLRGFAPFRLKADLTFELADISELIGALHAQGVRTVCFCGALNRADLPDLPGSSGDADGALAQLRAAMPHGDDGALRQVIALFERAGFAVRGVQDLAPGLLPEPGLLTQAQSSVSEADLRSAEMALQAMAARDEGQSCVIRDGAVLAQEAQDGTDAMLARLAGAGSARGGVFFKAPKPGQDLRADLPTIGPETARGAIAAGLSGLVIEAGGVLVLERGALVALLDEAGLFLWVREPGAA